MPMNQMKFRCICRVIFVSVTYWPNPSAIELKSDPAAGAGAGLMVVAW
jgi:hypothetical protein